jgi:glyoxylase-like metal-dependent hydrolase (beta-lactamase superfamily II)
MSPAIPPTHKGSFEVSSPDQFYFRQFLSGRDFAQSDQFAHQMVNFAYAIGDRQSGEAVLVDPAYDVAGLLGELAADEMRCVGVLASHYHADHVGGALGTMPIEGIAVLLDQVDVPIHVHRDEIPWVERTTGVGGTQLTSHDSGDCIAVGGVEIELIHTPGHTPGSQCFLVRDCLVSGDTLFLQGCGRTDFPGGDPEALYDSLVHRLARVPDGAVLFPGHRYSPEPSMGMADVRQNNIVFAPHSLDEWLMMFGPEQ